MTKRHHRHNDNTPGHAHELTFSCYRGYKFLSADRTRQWFVEAVEQARVYCHFQVWAYVVMPEHVHVVVFPTSKTYDIAAIRRAIKQPVARRGIQFLLRHAPEWENRVTRGRGKRTERLFWQSGGGYDRSINRYETLYSMIEYAHENPVRRQLTPRAIDWQWSSARHYEGMESGPLHIDPISW